MIRQYNDKTDRECVNQLMMELQQYFADIDSTKESLPFTGIESAHQYMAKMINDAESMSGAIFIATNDKEEVVGFIQGVIIHHRFGEDVIYDTTHDERRDGWIGLLYVNKNQRGNGFGKALMNKIQEHFIKNNCDTIRLLVLHDNSKAVDIYKKYGFIYHDVEMVKKIK